MHAYHVKLVTGAWDSGVIFVFPLQLPHHGTRKGSPAHDLTITFDNSVVATTNTAWNLGKGSPAHDLTITFDNSVLATTNTAWNLGKGSPAHDLTITFDNSMVATTNTAWNLGVRLGGGGMKNILAPKWGITEKFDNR
ncbi:unnamed protein product [Pleuronectes platessa]|uniref:Uncharacterized protein n=1 Tax=Pleuronectes platessa TaxID=8262 RepID=A0A9N7UH20_PLEPL|nr:unnamed protein product [Pleuronectes platessa]